VTETTGRVWRTFRRAAGILAFVAFATGASADDSTREFTATAVQVLDGSASLHYHTGYLITSVTGDLGGAGIPETIRLGDTISVQDRKLTVHYIYGTECLKRMEWGGEVFCDVGQTYCVAVERPEDVPSDEERDRQWIYVKKCKPIE
jgi:hypothetical protein